MKNILTLIPLLLIAASTGSAEVFTHINAENGVVEYDLAKDQGNGWYSESTGAYRFKLGFKQGERDSATPVHVATLRTTEEEHFKGTSALELLIKANEEKKSLRAAYMYAARRLFFSSFALMRSSSADVPLKCSSSVVRSVAT
ncbi:MAG: hypothetical protein WCJ02_13230 [bacterium]